MRAATFGMRIVLLAAVALLFCSVADPVLATRTKLADRETAAPPGMSPLSHAKSRERAPLPWPGSDFMFVTSFGGHAANIRESTACGLTHTRPNPCVLRAAALSKPVVENISHCIVSGAGHTLRNTAARS